MPHLHLSSLVTKKKIETGVIFFHSTSRLCTYPYLAHLLYIIKCVPHCPVHTPPSTPPPTAHLSIPPQHPIRRTSRQERQARQQNTPAAAHPTSTTCGQPSVATTPNVGAPFMTPVARQGETTGGPNTPATTRPTSTTCGQPSVTTTPNVGAPFMTPVARQGETTGEPNTSRRPAQHP